MKRLPSKASTPRSRKRLRFSWVNGPVMKGDTFAAKKFILEIPKTSFAKSNGRIKTGESAASTPILIRFDENSISVAMDAPIGALQNVIRNEKPGAEGQVAANIDVKLAAIASQLPHMLDLPEGVKIEGGNLKQTLNLVLAPDKAVIKQVLDLADLRGMRQGQAIVAKPVHWTFEGTSLGGGGTVPPLPAAQPVWFAIAHGRDYSLDAGPREQLLLAAHQARPNSLKEAIA